MAKTYLSEKQDSSHLYMLLPEVWGCLQHERNA